MPPDSARQTLTSAAAALAVSLDEAQVASLLAYLELLTRWNRVYNLTAVRDPARMLHQHLFDSLTVVEPLRRFLSKSGRAGASVLDVGSGAGLPGVVLAVALPELQITCVDAVGKKASFIQQVAGELGLANLASRHSRVENLSSDPADVIVSRAFASLADFAELTRHCIARDGVWLAMKGKLPKFEISAVGDGVEVFHVEQLQLPGLEADRCLVWMKLADSYT